MTQQRRVVTTRDLRPGMRIRFPEGIERTVKEVTPASYQMWGEDVLVVWWSEPEDDLVGPSNVGVLSAPWLVVG